MNLEEAVQTFGLECTELLDTMENALLRLELEPSDPDLVNEVFRAAHTIKGSAGLFGFDAVVRFAHQVESMLDCVRAGSIVIDRPITALLLECRDHVASLVSAATAGKPDAVDGEAGEALLARLGELMGASAASEPDASAHGHAAATPAAPAAASAASEPDDDPDAWGGFAGTAARSRDDDEAAGADDTAADGDGLIVDGSARERDFILFLGFGREVLRNGMDPLSFLRYLARLGELQHIETNADGLPAVEQLDPECNYLSFEVFFRSSAAREAIEQVFEFVREDCELRIETKQQRRERLAAAEAALPVFDAADAFQPAPPPPATELEGDAEPGPATLAGGAQAPAASVPHEPGTSTELSARGEPAARAAAEPSAAPADDGPAVAAKPRRAPAGPASQVAERPAKRAKGDEPEPSRVADARAREGKLIRVDAEKLDQLINLVGELVIAGAGCRLHAERSGLSALIEQTTSVSRLVEEVRNAALGLRMVQIGATFQRYHRVVRDVSHELGKDIELLIDGAETELDKSIVEQLGDPLLHLVRNSMDHGIESVEARVQAGKNPRGQLRLNAYHDSGSVVVEVADDGGGLRRDKILAKAISRGLIAADQVLSDREVYQLIFEAGFSTADTVSNLSGRGVGMDVVRSSVEALRGVIELDSQPGQGTTVRIRLPLTLAIIDGFLVRSGPVHYVIPLEMVVECLGFSAADRSSARERGFISVRGEALPVVRLSDSFALPGNTGQREDVVVVKSGPQAAGLVVDELLGELQTVIKPLGKLFAHVRGISGSALLGSGEVALILDVNSLVQDLARGADKAAQLGARRAPGAAGVQAAGGAHGAPPERAATLN